ncbi:MAG TPA: hypothetical protein VGN63_16985 [Flavisolibacter sp.]|jgi:hypothetical protein|nr:hypothetical protein [Flavisolibacter sp.]
MLQPKRFLLLALLLSLAILQGRAQESVQPDQPLQLPDKTITVLNEKARGAEEKLAKTTEKYLGKLQRQEQKLKAKLWKRDSALAKQLFEGVQEKYEALKQAPQNLSKYSQVYSGHLDSLTTALKFLKGGRPERPELTKALSQFSSLQGKLDQSEKIRSFLSERKRLLQESLGKLGLLKNLKGFQKQAYYYSQQVHELKSMWEDPSKLEKKLLEVLSQTEAFKDFFRRNSQLASLFALPGSNTAAASLAGLQTRASVQQGLQDRFGSGAQVQQMVQQNLQAAQGQLSELKNKLSQYSTGTIGNSNGDIDMPEGFKPNNQKTKTFLQRLEYGANVQSQKASSYFPTTSDLAFSLGYKLSDKSSIGVGASYKLGWGRGWDYIRITHEGVGLRSYLDVKLNGSIYLSGGYEQNYRTAFQNIQQLRGLSGWQKSGLLGLSKRYQVSKKLKGDIKLLWDFLSYQQTPRTQTVLFRVGYHLK